MKVRKTAYVIALYGNRSYLLWHNPEAVINRASKFFDQSRCEVVISSMKGRIEHFAAIRHRIAHAHASSGFDQATVAIAGRRYPAARPGVFLRDWAPHSPVPMRWIEVIVMELRGLAFQIVPV